VSMIGEKIEWVAFVKPGLLSDLLAAGLFVIYLLLHDSILVLGQLKTSHTYLISW